LDKEGSKIVLVRQNARKNKCSDKIIQATDVRLFSRYNLLTYLVLDDAELGGDLFLVI
jgi:hypothetical protein